MPFEEVCLGRNQSEDGAKLNMRWMRGVFVGKLDRTDECICDRTFWTSTDALQDAQVVLESGSTQRNAEQELNKKWWTKVMQLKLRLVKKLWKSQMQI